MRETEKRWSLRSGYSEDHVVFETNDPDELDRVAKRLARTGRVGVFEHGVPRGRYSTRGLRVDRPPQPV